jgi:tetratricopeptide (TPR) repeat protein
MRVAGSNKILRVARNAHIMQLLTILYLTNFERFCFRCLLSIVLNKPKKQSLSMMQGTSAAPFPCSISSNAAEEERARHQSTAIRLSNYGVALMEQEQHVPAVEALSRALKMCRQIMNEAEDFPAPMSTSLDACMEASRLARRKTDSPLGQRYLHQQAIRIPLDMGYNYRACVMLSTMVTFNLALAKQLTSVQGLAADSKAMLRKASKLYELAFSMQQEEEFDGNTLFTLATVNNLGLIHSQLNDNMAADKCFEYLLSTLMYLTNSGGERHAFFDGFFRNATTLIQKSKAAPAA